MKQIPFEFGRNIYSYHQIKNLLYDYQGLVVPAAVEERPAEADAEDVLPVVQLYRLLVAVHRGLPLLNRAEVLRLLPVGQASVRVVSAYNLTLENIKNAEGRFLAFIMDFSLFCH